MTNWEVGTKFIQEAERILKRDAVGAYEEGSWNLSIGGHRKRLSWL